MKLKQLTTIPSDLVGQILFFLPLTHLLLSQACVCKEWANLLRNSEMWKENFFRDFGKPGELSLCFISEAANKDLSSNWYKAYLKFDQISCEITEKAENAHHNYMIGDCTHFRRFNCI